MRRSFCTSLPSAPGSPRISRCSPQRSPHLLRQLAHYAAATVSAMEVLAVWALALLAGCRSGGTGRIDAARFEDADGEGGSDVQVAADAGGRYQQGSYLCCAKGEERSSCCPPDSLPDPSVGRTATCFQYGGTFGDCVPEGQSLEAKDICSICCGGLVRLEASASNGDAGACAPTGPPSIFICGACGNGVCGPGENACNCPGDCQ